MIAYDTNVLIYFLESNAEFQQRAERIIRDPRGALLSVLITQEVLTGYACFGDTITLQRAAYFLENLPRTTYVSVTATIIDKAVELTREYGRKLRGYDAIHLATALENGVEAFYTNDQELLALGRVGKLELRDLG